MVINQDVYDGSLIHERFAYKFFKKKTSATGNIVAFRAPMEVTANLIDLEDSLSRDFIYSEDALNFCWEIPNLCPVGAVAFQRLFMLYIADILAKELNIAISVKGDDLIVIDSNFPKSSKFPEGGKGKASVSITYSKDSITLGHAGINIHAGSKAPDFAYSLKLTDDQCKKITDEVIGAFYHMTQDMFVATTKVIV